MKLPTITALILVTSTISNATILEDTVTADDAAKSLLVGLHAMPPNPNPYQVTSDDGKIVSPPIHLVVTGELTSTSTDIYEETEDGYTVELSEGGEYKYLNVNHKGDLITTNLVAGKDDPSTSQLKIKKNAASKAAAIKKAALERDIESKHNTRKLLRGNTPNESTQEHRRTVITSGVMKNLVIPFKFLDHTSRILPSRDDLNTLMNNVGPDPLLCPTGSVRDVYLTNSFNQFDLQSIVFDWVTIDFTESYCAGGDSGLRTGFHECLQNALDKAVLAGLDASEFDLDNNGVIDGMTFFHSSYAAEFGGTDAYGTGQNGRIWSHKWNFLSSNSAWGSINNGVRAEEYHINPAVWSTTGSAIGRIGVVAHETGHFLGLPDLYDYGSGNGIGSYGLMANSWSFDGSQYYPPLMSAWGKEQLGWVDPITISTSGTYSLRQSCDHPDIVRIDEGFTNSEYLLIENRQPCSFDGSMPQGGLAIFHISPYANNRRGYPGQVSWPENYNHYKRALLQADGNYDLERRNRGDSTDLFHAGGVHAIGPDGTSNGRQYPNTQTFGLPDGEFITEVAISNISAASSMMTFDVSIQAPSVAPSTFPTVSNFCPSNPFLQRTLYFPLGSCYKVEFFSGGVIEVDNSDPTCSNSVFNSDEVISKFSHSDRGHIYFQKDGIYPYEGSFDFRYISTITGDVRPVANSVGGGIFDVTINVPSCDLGCYYESKLGSTEFVSVSNMCWKVELFEGGTVAADTSDPTCSKPEQEQNFSLVVSTFSYARGNKVYFDRNGASGWKGFFELNSDSTVSEVQVIPTRLDGALREYELGLAYSYCYLTEPPSISPTAEVCVDDPVGWHETQFGERYNCEYYGQQGENRCRDFGSFFIGTDNKYAVDACCVCGGGTTKEN